MVREPLIHPQLASVVLPLGDGVVVAVVGINRATGAIVGEPELVARGFVVDDDDSTLFDDAAGAIVGCVEASNLDERADQGLMTEKLRGELRRFFKKRSGRRPLVLPILMHFLHNLIVVLLVMNK